MSVASSLQADIKKIAADVASIGASASAVLVVVENTVANLHLPAGVNVAVAAAISLVGTVVLEARRIASGS